MTQEQKITKGTIIIFVLSIVLLICLCVTTTLAYFAGTQDTKTVLILGGPVRVSVVDRKFEDTIGSGQLVMDLKTQRDNILPGIGIDMQAIAKVTSSGINTPALLRAILDIKVDGINDTKKEKEISKQIRECMARCLTTRIDSSEAGSRDGWVYLEEDGNYYYCSQKKGVITNKDGSIGEEFIEVMPISTSSEGTNVTFINGTFQFPYKEFTNAYASYNYIENIYDSVSITFTVTFQAIQEKLVDENGDRIPNTIFNVKNVLDEVDWEKHNAE